MIGGYESHTVHLKGGGNNAPDALVNGFDGLDCSVEYTGVADHVAVGEIENDHVILSAFDSLANGVANGICAHFRLKVEGGHIGEWDENSVLALEFDLLTAVEEEGNMGIFCGFGNTQLGQSRL